MKKLALLFFGLFLCGCIQPGQSGPEVTPSPSPSLAPESLDSSPEPVLSERATASLQKLESGFAGLSAWHEQESEGWANLSENEREQKIAEFCFYYEDGFSNELRELIAEFDSSGNEKLADYARQLRTHHEEIQSICSRHASLSLKRLSFQTDSSASVQWASLGHSVDALGAVISSAGSYVGVPGQPPPAAQFEEEIEDELDSGAVMFYADGVQFGPQEKEKTALVHVLTNDYSLLGDRLHADQTRFLFGRDLLVVVDGKLRKKTEYLDGGFFYEEYFFVVHLTRVSEEESKEGVVSKVDLRVNGYPVELTVIFLPSGGTENGQMTLYSGEARLTPSQKRFDDFINLNPVGKPACGASVLARSSSTSNDFEKHFDVSFDPVVSCGADGKHVDFLVYSRGASPDKLWSENLNFEVTFGRMLGESFKVTIPFVFDSDGEVVEGISPEEISGFLFVEDDENLKWAQKKQGVWSEIKAEFKKQIIGVPNPENPELIVESFVVGEPEEIGKADAVSFSKKDTYYSLGGQVFKKGNPAFLVSEDTLKVYLKKNKAFFDLPQGVKEVNLETGEETLYCPSLCNASAFESGSLNVFVYCSNTESIVSIRGEGGSCSTAQVLARGNKITDFLAEEQEIYWVGEENGAYSVKVFADGKTKTIFENPKTALPASISVYDGGLFGGKWLYWIEYDTETHQNRIKRINV